MDSFTFDRPYGFTSYKCYYTDCIPPPDPNTVPPVTTRPFEYDYWDDETIWDVDSDGYIANVGFNGTDIPLNYENVRILFGMSLTIIDVSIVLIDVLNNN